MVFRKRLRGRNVAAVKSLKSGGTEVLLFRLHNQPVESDGSSHDLVSRCWQGCEWDQDRFHYSNGGPDYPIQMCHRQYTVYANWTNHNPDDSSAWPRVGRLASPIGSIGDTLELRRSNGEILSTTVLRVGVAKGSALGVGSDPSGWYWIAEVKQS